MAWQSLTIKTTQAHGERQMKEKLTGLDWRDFVAMRLGIQSLIKDYQNLIDNGLSPAGFYETEVEDLKVTLKKINENRSLDI
jgi:hypothetical protein